MKNLILILALFVSFTNFAAAQTKEEAKIIATNQIKELKTGVLIVRLYNKMNVISALKEKGMMKRAEAIRARQEKVNNEIIKSFTRFEFCDVYFFYSNQSQHIIDAEYSKVELFTLAGKANIDLEKTEFLVADFGFLTKESDLVQTENKKNSPNKSKVKTYKGSSTNTSKKCIIIRDSSLKQLQSPFPYRVFFHPTPIKNLSYKQVVERMDAQLSKYYAKSKLEL